MSIEEVNNKLAIEVGATAAQLSLSIRQCAYVAAGRHSDTSNHGNESNHLSEIRATKTLEFIPFLKNEKKKASLQFRPKANLPTPVNREALP